MAYPDFAEAGGAERRVVAGARVHGIPLVESRETSYTIPQSRSAGRFNREQASPVAKSWAHFVAGG